jgi:nucleoside-diphosphate-sugar epimerase
LPCVSKLDADSTSSQLFETWNYFSPNFTESTTMTRVLLTGGSGFIAAHTLDILLEHGHSVVTTVRTQEKADKIKASYKSYADKGQLDFAIVPDIAQPDAFEKAVVSDPPFEAVLHTASPFTFNITDIQKVSNMLSLVYKLS